MRMWRVSATAYRRALQTAQDTHARVADATTPADEWEWDTFTDYYLTADLQSGFAVRSTGELVGVFSTVKGRGDDLLSRATRYGARRLDCFDGYLVDFYKRHGFRVERREANWVAGEPDVVYMTRTA